MSRGQLIVCEGVDGSGKTTSIDQALKLTDKEYEFLYVHGLKGYSPLGVLASKCPSTLSFLAEQLYLDRTLIVPSLKKGANLLLDRWFYTVVSYNENSSRDRLLERLFTPLFSKPDLFIFYTASLEERLRRLEQKPGHENLLRHPEKIILQENSLRRHYDNFQGAKALIDTTGKTIEESGSELYCIVKNYLEKVCI